MIKVLAVTLGIFGAMIASQYPAFTQQYIQRLGGEVDALQTVISDFDRSARKSGMTRDEALASMGGTTFLEHRRRDIRNTIGRHDTLKSDLAYLSQAEPLERLTVPYRFADRQTASATWGAFQPAMPFSIDGLLAAFGGFVLVYLTVNAVFWCVLRPFRRRSKKTEGLQF